MGRGPASRAVANLTNRAPEHTSGHRSHAVAGLSHEHPVARPSGRPPMSIAFVFPGQGSQTIGMGRELAEAFPESRQVFEEVDEALGEKLSTLMWEGDAEELQLTRNAQPALMAVSIAAARALAGHGIGIPANVTFVAGHSLGEYSALAAAQSFTVAEAAKLLRVRGEAMQSAVPVGEGAMAAIIGLDEETVERVCGQAAEMGGTCEIANDNGGNQLVISGNKDAVEMATVLLKENGAKRAMTLPVSAPFHSSLMSPAAERMREALSETPPRDPSVLLVANVTAEPVGEGTAIADLLVRQVTGRVRWRESVEAMDDRGVDLMIELGAGKVLSGLAKRIASGMEAMPCGTPDEVRAVARRIEHGDGE